MRQIEIGLATLFSLVMGLTVAVFGVAIIRSTHYPSWMGTLGLLGAVGLVAAGAAQGSTGFSGLAMTLSMAASGVLIVWVVLLGAFMWRLARQWTRDTGSERDSVREVPQHPRFRER